MFAHVDLYTFSELMPLFKNFYGIKIQAFYKQWFSQDNFLNNLLLKSQKQITFLLLQLQSISYLNPMVKVGIIGAGLSGLTAARQILSSNSKAQVIVLQSNNRVGGRTYTIDVQGNHYDMGASFIGKTQIDVISLANQANNQLVPQFQKGTKVMDIGNQISTYSSTIPNNVNIFSLLNMQWMLWKINRMAKKVPVQNPKQCKSAQIWDSMTLHTWISKNTSSQKVKKMIQAAIRVVFGADLSQLSFLYFLWYVHQSETLDNLVNIQNGLQQKKLKLGTQQLSIFLSKQVQKKGGKIYLNSYVKRVTQKDNKVYVQTSNNQKFQFDYLVIAMPPSNVSKISFQPQLSPQKKFITQKSFMGSIGKLVIRYKQSYWKNKGFSGQVLSDGCDSPITLTYDDTKANQNGQIQAAMIVFVGGGQYRYWIQYEQLLKNTIIKKLSQYFKQPQMLTPLSIHYQKWDQNKSINGGPVGCFPPGLLTHIDQLRKPEGRIHWAGTQLARRSCGFMDGAIESGKRVSKQVIDRINGKENFTSKKQGQKQNKQLWYTKFVKKQSFFQWW